MKSKAFSISFVFVLCFTLFIFTSQSAAVQQNQDKNPMESLDDKIAEIINVLQMNLDWEPDSEIRPRLTGFFQKYKSNSPQKFKFKKAAIGAPGEVEEVPEAMAEHLFDNKGKEIKFRLTKFEYEEYETVEEATKGNEHKIDAKALVHIKYSWTENPRYIGEISIELFHMKICIWD